MKVKLLSNLSLWLLQNHLMNGMLFYQGQNTHCLVILLHLAQKFSIGSVGISMTETEASSSSLISCIYQKCAKPDVQR